MGHRLRRSTLAALVLFGALLVAGLLYLQRNNPWLAERVAGLVTRNLLSTRGYSLHLAGIEGRLPGELVLHGLRISYLGPGHAPFDLFTARRVALRVSLAGLLRGDFLAESLLLEEATLRAYKVRAAGWAYPGFDSPGGGRSGVQVAIDALGVDRLQVLRETPAGPDTLVLRDTACRLYRSAEGTSLDLDRLRLEHSGRPPVDLSGLFLLRTGGRLDLAGIDVLLPVSHLNLRGELGLAGGLRLDLGLTAAPARLGELAAAIGQELETDSELTGQLQLAGAPDSLQLEGRLSGTLFDFRLEEVGLRGLYADGRLAFAALEGRLNDNQLEAAATFTLPIKGREFGYSADAQLSHFDLETFLPGTPPTDLSGAVNIVDPGGAGRFRFTLGPGRFDAYPFASATGQLLVVGDTLTLSAVEVADRGLAATLSGRIHPGAETLAIEVEAVSDSARLAGVFAGDSLLGGHVEVRGRFAGPALSPAMALDGTFARLTYFGARLGRGEFALRSDALALQPTLIHAEGDSLAGAGLAFARFYLDAELHGDTLRLRHGSAEGADLALDLSGQIDDLLAAAPRLRLDRAWLRWLGREWLNERPLDLRLGEEPALGLARWRSSQGSVALRWNRPDQGPDRLELVDLDLAQLGPWLPPKLALAGRLSGVVERSGPASYALRARLERIRLHGEPAGRAELALRWEGDSLAVDSLAWEPGPGRRLRLAGGLGGLPPAARGPAALAELDPARLVAALGLEVRDFPLERLTRLSAATAFLGGALSGRIQLAGPLAQPTLGAEAGIDSLRLWQLRVDRLDLAARLADGKLSVHRLAARRGKSRVEGAIGLPLALGLGRPPRLPTDGALTGSLRLAADAEDLLGLSDLLAEADGRLEGEISLAGTPAAPRPAGQLRLQGGLLRLAGWEERLSEIEATAALRGDTLAVLALTAAESSQWARYKAGQVRAQGWLTWVGPFRYSVTADLERCAYGTLPFFSGLVSGQLTLSTWDEAEVPPHPFLSGDLVVHEGTLSYDFADVTAAPGPSLAPIFSYDLGVRAERKLLLVNKEANLELSGDLRLSSTPDGQDVSGELATLRGSYLVFGNKFHLVQGELDFTSAEGINPKIDILAEARKRDDKIQIRITNTFAEPQIEVISEQGYSREDVLRILAGLPVAGEAGGGQAGAAVAGRVEAELLNRLEQVVSGELSGVVDFGLENRNLEGTAGEVETRWRIGRYLPGGLYVSYNQGLSMGSDREVALEYRLYNRLYLRSEVVNRGGQYADEGLINEYNVDIRFRYEY
ncbi:hypothetical protein FJ251_09120 [bacterium]|nr:hypothetical protein [bacterium]